MPWLVLCHAKSFYRKVRFLLYRTKELNMNKPLLFHFFNPEIRQEQTGAPCCYLVVWTLTLPDDGKQISWLKYLYVRNKTFFITLCYWRKYCYSLFMINWIKRWDVYPIFAQLFLFPNLHNRYISGWFELCIFKQKVKLGFCTKFRLSK